MRLTSLCTTVAVTFKVQTSSSHKFLVKPPIGLIPPLSHVTFQVILKPQAQLPPAYPRLSSDRFLIRTAKFLTIKSTQSESINHWFSSSSFPHRSTHNIRLKVALLGPLLLHHAVTCGDYDGVRNIIKRQRMIIVEFSPAKAKSILRIATELENPKNLINLLLVVGLRIGPIGANVSCSQVYYEGDSKYVSNEHDQIRVAKACGRLDHILGLRESSAEPTTTIDHSHSRHDFAHDKDASCLLF